jgi:hypothetical protein
VQRPALDQVSSDSPACLLRVAALERVRRGRLAPCREVRRLTNGSQLAPYIRQTGFVGGHGPSASAGTLPPWLSKGRRASSLAADFGGDLSELLNNPSALPPTISAVGPRVEMAQVK